MSAMKAELELGLSSSMKENASCIYPKKKPTIFLIFLENATMVHEEIQNHLLGYAL